jgi:Cu-Zn family superoxide dismutase
MEASLFDEDMVYATCDMRPNRHISLILQENVKGTVNMWQKSGGNGPLFMHLKLRGFRVLSNEQRLQQQKRRKRSDIIPVEEPFDEEGVHSQPMHSIEHGMHVHVYGNLSRDCQYTGLHYNPTNSVHGGPLDQERHVGDLGNIRVDLKGEVDVEVTFPRVSLTGGHSIIGRSLVIHGQRDDYGQDPNSEASVTTGNSEAKIACCIIQRVDRLPLEPDSESGLHPLRGQKRPERLESPVQGIDMETEE